MPSKKQSGHRQRLKDRFLNADNGSQTDEALLELLLSFAIPRKDVRPISEKLIQEIGDFDSVLSADYKSLCHVDGIGEHSATLLKLSDWIRRNFAAEPLDQLASLTKTPIQADLFPKDETEKEEIIKEEKPKEPKKKKLIKRKGSILFVKAVLKETIAIMPDLPDTESLEDIKNYLQENLHYNAFKTRQRYANYIIRRTFHEGYADLAMRSFAKTYKKTRDLKEVCYYRFTKTEPLVGHVVKELMQPSIGRGRLPRKQLRDYLAERFPESKSTKDCAQAIADALAAGGIAKVDRLNIKFGYRDIPISAFAFILHSEFPEPGMYDLAKLENNESFQTMLWNPDSILSAIYELRNMGLISKISEIDNVRQFTTQLTLEEVVNKLTS